MSWADGHRTESVEFDYAEIDRRLGYVEPGETVSTEKIMASNLEAYFLPLRETLDWILQKVPKNEDGIQIRAVIAGWIFLPHLNGANSLNPKEKHLTLTDLAAMVGRDKQSLGRWVDDFKKTFPGVKTPNMKNG